MYRMGERLAHVTLKLAGVGWIAAGLTLFRPSGGERKVRSPQSSVPVNDRGGPLIRGLYGKCHRKYTAAGFVRVRR